MFHSSKIGPVNYLDDHFIVAISCQKLYSEDGAPLLANLNTAQGDLISISGKNVVTEIGQMFITIE